MEKIYTKNGYTYTSKFGKVITVTKEVLEKAVSDQNDMLTNIQANIDVLKEDLLQISNL